MVINQNTINVGTPDEVRLSLIAEFKKSSSLVEKFAKGIVLNSSNYDVYNYLIFSLGSFLARLSQYALYDDEVRSLVSDAQNNMTKLGDWFASIDGLSQKWIKQSMEYLVGMSNIFVQLSAQPKILQKTELSVSLSMPSPEQIIEKIQDLQSETAAPLASPSTASSPEVAYLKPYPPSRPQKVGLEQRHPMFSKYLGKRHPVDTAILNELSAQGIDVEGATKEDVDEIWERALLGRMYSITQEYKNDSNAAGARILRELREQKVSQELNDNPKTTLEQKESRRSTAAQVLEWAATLLAQQAKQK